MRLRHELDRYALFTATAIFTLTATATATGGLDVPGGLAVLTVFPAVLLLVPMLRRGLVLENELRVAAGWSALVLVSFELVPFLISSALIAVGLPFAIGVAVLVAKAPAVSTVLVALFAAIAGTFQAFIGFSPSFLVDLLLVSLWLVLLARATLGRPYHFVLWPAVLGCGIYMGLTIVDMLTADNLGVAWIGFRTTVWYMLGFVALAYAGFSRETYRRIATGFVFVAALVAGYATFRWVVGPAGPERELAVFGANAINVDPITGHLRTVGSFQTGHQLAFWAALMGPFCFAYALWATGWKRLLGVGAVGLCVLAMIASEARGPLPGFVLGAAIVILIYQFARAYPGFKPGIALLVLTAVVGTATTVYVLGERDPERLARYTRVLEPETDPTFIQRQLKWDQVTTAIEDRPFGHGLGTGGAGQASGDVVQLSEFNLDSSYLKIAYEQGILALALYVVAVIGLLISLIVASVRTHSKEAAAFGMAACGTLASMLVSFYTGVYIEVLPIASGWLAIGLGLSYFVARSEPSVAPLSEPVAREQRQRPPAVPVAAE